MVYRVFEGVYVQKTGFVAPKPWKNEKRELGDSTRSGICSKKACKSRSVNSQRGLTKVKILTVFRECIELDESDNASKLIKTHVNNIELSNTINKVLPFPLTYSDTRFVVPSCLTHVL